MTDSALWQAVLGDLELATSKANFETWLRPTKLVSLSEKVARISAPNIFVRGRLESHYKQNFLESFSKHGAQIQEIQFTIEGGDSSVRNEPSQPVRAESEVSENTEQANSDPSTIMRHHVFDTF